MSANGSLKTIAVFSPTNYYLSHCTWKKALSLLQQGKAIRLNATTIRLKQTKAERIRIKRDIIASQKRHCYICNKEIPVNEKATIDHVIPKSRDYRADLINNMKCCCERCNNDKADRTIVEYVQYIQNNRELYSYISDKRLTYLATFAKHFEEQYWNGFIDEFTGENISEQPIPFKKKKGKRKHGKH